MHDLHDMFYFERKKTFMHILTVFVCGYLPAAMFIFFLAYFFFFFWGGGGMLANFFFSQNAPS